MKKISREFYNRDSITVAKEILGKVLVYDNGEQRVSAKIVEAEAYRGTEDQAAHSYGGKRTPRVEVMYGEAGFAYVFMIYGMYFCLNLVTNAREIPQAVLIRAAEPVDGLELMSQRRFGKEYARLTKSQSRGLTNGPGKLCKAFAIDKNFNGMDLCGSKLYFEEGSDEKFTVIETKRVGVDYAGEAKDYPWRFYIEGNEYVSVK